jgi:hypothetical protein
MTERVISRTLLLSRDQVAHARIRIRQELQARNITDAVAKAIRSGLIEKDEIGGGPLTVNEMEAREAILSYRLTSQSLPPPEESWPELRARAHRIAEEFRSLRHQRS